MEEIDVFIDLVGHPPRSVGLLRQHPRGGDAITFEYHTSWLELSDSFSIDPALPLEKGIFSSPDGMPLFGAIGDTSPDSWGRRLMRKAEQRLADRDGRQARTLSELHYLLRVSDHARLGSLRFVCRKGSGFSQAESEDMPPLRDLGRLIHLSERVGRNDETVEELLSFLAPATVLGGARPKVSVIDDDGHLTMAKLPKASDDYSIETWEEIALRLAERAGIVTPRHRLIQVLGKPVLLSRRFDRVSGQRIPFLSGMSITRSRDGEMGSYPELVEALEALGAQARVDVEQLYRRVAFNVLVSNVDDHLRNHGFLWAKSGGWTLSPAYDLNPTPGDVKSRHLSSTIDLHDNTCSVELLQEAAGYFGLELRAAREIIREVGMVTATWRAVAEEVGARRSETARMASAFEHDDLRSALHL